MDRTALRQALLEMVENNRGEPVEAFDESMNLRTDLGLDSVDMVTLVMEIQDRFHLRLALSELEHVQRAGQMLDLLEARLSSPPLPRKAAA
jgi:acyl carrier protein